MTAGASLPASAGAAGILLRSFEDQRMKLLDLDVAFEQGDCFGLNLLGRHLAQGVLPIEQFGKRQQRPDELGRLDDA
ncbi:hypothetical protein XI02_17830 [Bradyrhizobium sp. CCBAU 21365]|nr:hypothetical protein XI02_17830 [Bradyrhizobium sp. CCBAU 21365]